MMARVAAMGGGTRRVWMRMLHLRLPLPLLSLPLTLVVPRPRHGLHPTTPVVEYRSFYVYFPPKLCSSNATIPTIESWRIILGLHDYGGGPLDEIRKWREAAISLNAIILAPEGTMTESENKLGWNAIECCGDPVVNEVDDVDFLVNGTVEVFLNSIKKEGPSNGVHVIAAGFGNGGFMSSLLGLLPGETYKKLSSQHISLWREWPSRPSWLGGTVSMGGYQYDLAQFYFGLSSTRPEPLPVMMHHGALDAVVSPNGCCQLPNDVSRSNCDFGIGAKEALCMSVQNTFGLWSSINRCNSTVRDEGITNGKELEPGVTCWKGIECNGISKSFPYREHTPGIISFPG
ncbi:hypothetical protein ACHAWF_014053 [Thalassiosira exigua]